MTSKRFNEERVARQRELEIFDRLPESLRAALNECEEAPPKPSTVRDALLRGITIEALVALIRRKKQ